MQKRSLSKLFWINSFRTFLRALFAWPLLVLGLYVTAAIIGGAIPINETWRPPITGSTIYLYDNGVHTSLILPRDLAGYDLGQIVAEQPETLKEWQYPIPDNRFPGSIERFPFIMIGWGDTKFFRETPTWFDVRPDTALTALIGSGQASMHVDRLTRLPPDGFIKLVLRDTEYKRLIEFLLLHFPRSEDAKITIEKGYGADDRFYPIDRFGYQANVPKLHYSAMFTCNNWISEALKRAGVKTGYWTPLPFGVRWWHD